LYQIGSYAVKGKVELPGLPAVWIKVVRAKVSLGVQHLLCAETTIFAAAGVRKPKVYSDLSTVQSEDAGY